MDNVSTDHLGHRQRLRNQFLAGGMGGLTDLQALELLLCFAIPRRDVQPLAQALLDRFGSYYSVLEARPEQLRSFSGISDHVVALILLMNQTMHVTQPANTHNSNNSLLDWYHIKLLPMFQSRFDEALILFGLDANGQILHSQYIGEGSLGTSAVPLRKIVSTAIAMDVNAVLVAHNHPSGILYPSEPDITATVTLQHALSALDITLIDHVILARNDILSITDFILDNI